MGCGQPTPSMRRPLFCTRCHLRPPTTAPHIYRQAAHTAAVVNELSEQMQRILAPHPLNAERVAQGLNSANVVLLRGCGSRCVGCALCVMLLCVRHAVCCLQLAPGVAQPPVVSHI